MPRSSVLLASSPSDPAEPRAPARARSSIGVDVVGIAALACLGPVLCGAGHLATDAAQASLQGPAIADQGGHAPPGGYDHAAGERTWSTHASPDCV